MHFSFIASILHITELCINSPTAAFASPQKNPALNKHTYCLYKPHRFFTCLRRLVSYWEKRLSISVRVCLLSKGVCKWSSVGMSHRLEEWGFALVSKAGKSDVTEDFTFWIGNPHCMHLMSVKKCLLAHAAMQFHAYMIPADPVLWENAALAAFLFYKNLYCVNLNHGTESKTMYFFLMGK